MRKLLAGLAAISLALAPAVAFASPGDDHTIRVHNESGIGATIVTVALQNAEGEVYTARNGTVHAGYYRDIVFDDGTGRCYYDIAAKFDNGRIARHNNVNVCQTANWHVYDLDSTIDK